MAEKLTMGQRRRRAIVKKQLDNQKASQENIKKSYLSKMKGILNSAAFSVADKADSAVNAVAKKTVKALDFDNSGDLTLKDATAGAMKGTINYANFAMDQVDKAFDYKTGESTGALNLAKAYAAIAPIGVASGLYLTGVEATRGVKAGAKAVKNKLDVNQDGKVNRADASAVADKIDTKYKVQKRAEVLGAQTNLVHKKASHSVQNISNKIRDTLLGEPERKNLFKVSTLRQDQAIAQKVDIFKAENRLKTAKLRLATKPKTGFAGTAKQRSEAQKKALRLAQKASAEARRKNK